MGKWVSTDSAMQIGCDRCMSENCEQCPWGEALSKIVATKNDTFDYHSVSQEVRV